MEKAMDLEHLPLEVVEVIGTYLSAGDLSRCLGVSRAWYNIFSDDIFWKRHCIDKSDGYLSKSKCLVEPGFIKPPAEILSPIQKNRLQFLQEQHLWNNWDSGRFKREEIEFDCDDSISYNINVSFLDNDHVCLHRTSETEVWNVVETPFRVMTIPYCLKEMWEANVYKIIENNLVVIQCNVVQVYKISLDSKSWSLNQVFFFNKPEEFSSGITAETDVDGLFQLESISSDGDNFSRIICGQYFVGSYKGEETPHLHVWNLMTGKKVKEDTCEICKGIISLHLTAPKKETSRVLVTFKLKNGSEIEKKVKKYCSAVYDLSKLEFLLPVHDHNHCPSGTVKYFDGNLSVLHDFDCSLKLLHHDVPVKKETNFVSLIRLPKVLGFVTSIQPLGNDLLISNRKDVFLVNKSGVIITQNPANLSLLRVNFSLFHMDVLFKYALLHDGHFVSLREVWKLDKLLRKVIEFPSDSGMYAARNNACSKIVLERANKLIVLNFW